MADLTRFDFHVVRFMNSETVERMTSDEVGQFVLLLCKSWLLGKEASLPDDLPYLAKQARCRKVSPLVLEKFPVIQTVDGPRRRNEILYGEWLLAKDRQASASERGKKGNEVRYSDSNGGANSDGPATDQVTACSSPIPYHSTPSHSNPTQTKNSISFSGGSFGQGEFKNASARWWSYFRKQLQKSKQNKQQYADACGTYNEDAVLDYLELWAKSNQWVASHPRGENRLYVFLQALPDMVAGDELSAVREKDEEKVTNADADLATRMAEELKREQEQEEIETKKRKDQRAQELANALEF